MIALHNCTPSVNIFSTDSCNKRHLALSGFFYFGFDVDDFFQLHINLMTYSGLEYNNTKIQYSNIQINKQAVPAV